MVSPAGSWTTDVRQCSILEVVGGLDCTKEDVQNWVMLEKKDGLY